MIHKHTISFKNAWIGLKWAILTQPNFKIHFFLSFLSIIAAIVLCVTSAEFVAILTLIGVGLSIEIVNTAIEQATDAIDQKWREDIKLAKDVSAGAMLMFALFAALIAGYIFIPKIIQIVFF